MHHLLLLSTDDEWSLPLLALLERDGVQTTTVPDIFDAILHLREHPHLPLVIGPDIPDEDLPSILNGIRRHCPAAPRLILLSNGRAQPANETDAQAAGFDLCLQEPNRYVSLARTLLELVPNTAQSPEGEPGGIEAQPQWRGQRGSDGQSNERGERGSDAPGHGGRGRTDATPKPDREPVELPGQADRTPADALQLRSGEEAGPRSGVREVDTSLSADTSPVSSAPAKASAISASGTKAPEAPLRTDLAGPSMVPAAQFLPRELVFRAPEAAGPNHTGMEAGDIERLLRIARHEDYFSLLGLHPSTPCEEVPLRAEEMLRLLATETLDLRLQERFLHEVRELRAAIRDAAAVLGTPRAREVHQRARSADVSTTGSGATS